MLLFGGYTTTPTSQEEKKEKEEKEENPEQDDQEEGKTQDSVASASSSSFDGAGNTRGRTLNDVWLFNTTQHQWQRMNDCIAGDTPPPCSAYHHLLVVPGSEERHHELLQCGGASNASSVSNAFKHSSTKNKQNKGIPGTVVSQIVCVGVEHDASVSSTGPDDDDDDDDDQVNEEDEEGGEGGEEEEEGKSSARDSHSTTTKERFKHLYVLTVAVGESSYFTVAEAEEAKEAEATPTTPEEEEAQQRQRVARQRQDLLNGYVWTWSRVDCQPSPTSGALPSERCW